jgi:hypothetical protein
MGRETTNIETQKGHAMPETRRRPAPANYRVTYMATGAFIDVAALDGKAARTRGASYLGEAEDDLEVRALPLADPPSFTHLPLPMEHAVHAADGVTACWTSDHMRAYVDAHLKTRNDAELVMAALETGNWKLQRNPYSTLLTARANRESAWSVERMNRPYCAVYGKNDPRGMYGPRCWSAPTALEALMKAADDLGVPLIAPSVEARP